MSCLGLTCKGFVIDGVWWNVFKTLEIIKNAETNRVRINSGP